MLVLVVSVQVESRRAVTGGCLERLTLTSISAGQGGWVEPPDGIEPSTYALRVRRSDRLS